MIKIIGGKYKGSNLLVTKGDKVRPTSARKRKAIFDTLTSFFLKQENKKSFDNKIIVDAFAGSGAMGLEALSRGSKFCYFIEKDIDVIKDLEINCKNILKNNRYKIINSYFENITSSEFEDRIDIIFLDPPYQYIIDEKILLPLTKSINKDGIIIIETKSINAVPIIKFMEVFIEKVLGNAKFIFFKKQF